MARLSGTPIEYSEERTQALMAECDRYMAACRHIRMHDVFNHIVNQPCRRFWVSSLRAAIVISGMFKGDDLNYMRPTKREMFYEIFRRVKILKREHPEMSIYRLVSIVVAQPAPKFYLTPDSAKVMFYKAKKKWYEKKNRILQLKLRHW